MRRSVGGGQNTVIRSLRSQGTRSGPSRATSSSSTTSVAPTPNASQISSSEESYAADESSAARSSGPRPNRVTSDATRFAMPACSISTPFGLPVLPDV